MIKFVDLCSISVKCSIASSMTYEVKITFKYFKLYSSNASSEIWPDYFRVISTVARLRVGDKYINYSWKQVLQSIARENK